MIDPGTIKSLEFDKILEILSTFAASEVSRRKIFEMTPPENYEEIELLQKQTYEAHITKAKYNLSPMLSIDDIGESLSKAQVGGVLQMGELLRIARTLRAARIVKKDIEGTGSDIVALKDIVSTLFVDIELEKAITDSILSENEMKDDASAKLRGVRQKIRNLDAKLKDKLNSYMRSSSISSYLQDNIITVRSGRFVLPVKSECRSSIPGLIHDQSSSGATVFIEPFPIVELNNEIKSLKLDEAQEIERILILLSDMVLKSIDRVKTCFDVCVMLDIIYAKYGFSVHFKCSMPILNNKGEVKLLDARHPLIKSESVVPIDIHFGKDFKMLLITGPNTGGKTVCLKTVGLFCLMTYCGIFVPCSEGSCVAVFDSIFCDIGDEQSILNSLSTFSSHIVNLAHITNNITKNSLVLLDELGGGTDPEEGAALAIGIIKYLELMQSSGILTTHYGELKEYALVSKNLKNGCMQFDEATLKPTYKLIVGIPGVSNALKIAKNYGINDYILENAKKNIKSEKVQFELVLQNAEKVKADALREKAELEKAKNLLDSELIKVKAERTQIAEKLERINLNAQAETKKIINRNTEKAQEIIDQMKELIDSADEKALFSARQKMRELQDIQYLYEKSDTSASYRPVSKDSIKTGMKVMIVKIGTIGEVKQILGKDDVEVLCGNAVLRVRISDLGEIENSQSQKEKKTEILEKEIKPTTMEIKVLGLTVSEAIETIAPHIIAGIGQCLTIKIIHGKGTGALAAGIRGFLKTSREVKSFRIGGYHEGGSGVTFAEIK